MDGQVEVFFSVICDNDFNKEVTLLELLSSEKVIKAIKSDFAEGARNVQLSASQADAIVKISTEKSVYSYILPKDDIQDILELTEEYARSQKLLKGPCSRIELEDFHTIKS